MMRRSAKIRKVPLRELLDLSDSGTWGPVVSAADGFPVLRSSDIQDYRLLFDEVAYVKIPEKDRERKRLEPGDILVTKSSGSPKLIGKCCLFEPKDAAKDYYFSNFMLRLRPNESVLTSKWLYFWLTSEYGRFVLERFNDTTSGLRNLNIGLYLAQEVPIPQGNARDSLAEQKRIAAILDKADALRRKRKQSLKLLDEFIRSVFLEMFGDPVVNPKGWDKKRLTNCVIGKAQNGYFAKSDSYGETGTPIIWISDFIDKFYVDVTNIKRVTTAPEDIVRYEVNYGDVLFCRSSLNVEGIGKASIIPRHLPENTIYECHAIKISLNKTMLLPEFFRVQSNTEGFRMGIMQRAKTATMTTISQDGILDSPVIVPPIELQHRFTSIVEQCLTIYENAQQSSRELDNQFNSLVQRAFRGEL